MKFQFRSIFAALCAAAIVAYVPLRADNMASIAITPATGVVTLAPHWGLGSGFAGFHQMSQDLGLGGQANNFYSLSSAGIPNGGDVSAFNLYVAASGFATAHADIGSKLTPTSYSALTSADPDVGYGSVNLYMIHHKATGDYFSIIVPGSGVSSSVSDLKPMSGPGGPATLGASGYFGLTFASSNLGYGLNYFYYLRTDSVSGNSKFGTLDPSLLGTGTDEFDLGQGGHKALAFTGTDVGYGTDKMYYLRLDPITGFTILGMLDPSLAGVRHTKDIANLGSVYNTLTFTSSDLGFGVNQFYTTGAVNPTWQSVSFAAIADRTLSAGSFTVNPTASSGLPIVLTVITGSATISAPVAGVFTVTPTGPGLITLQAAQAGAINPTPYEANMLRQSFTVTGAATATSDFNADGKSDLVWRNSQTGEYAIWLMNGTTPATYVYKGVMPVAWRIAGTGDFNADGQADLIWSNSLTGEWAIWLMNGTTPVTYISMGVMPVAWQITGTGDFNADGKSDLIWRNTQTGEYAIWLMNGTTPTSYVYMGVMPLAWQIVGTGDFNADAKSDLIWRNTQTGEYAIWLMNGTTPSSYIGMGVMPLSWQITGSGDFNADGKSDLIWRNTTTGDYAFWLMNGTTPAGYISGGVMPVAWQIVK